MTLSRSPVRPATVTDSCVTTDVTRRGDVPYNPFSFVSTQKTSAIKNEDANKPKKKNNRRTPHNRVITVQENQQKKKGRGRWGKGGRPGLS
jgi:hypothetical protein